MLTTPGTMKAERQPNSTVSRLVTMAAPAKPILPKTPLSAMARPLPWASRTTAAMATG